MDIELFARAFAVGLVIAAPVGPIGLLIIRRGLQAGFAAGLCAGLGAATADGIYGAIAAYGLGAAALVLAGEGWWLTMLGAGFLVYLGARTLASPAPLDAVTPRPGDLAADYLSTALLTLTNPATILSFVAVFAGIGLGEAPPGWVSPLVVVAGVFLGSATWWVFLVAMVALFRKRLAGPAIVWINRIAGAALVGFGFAAGLAIL